MGTVATAFAATLLPTSVSGQDIRLDQVREMEDALIALYRTGIGIRIRQSIQSRFFQLYEDRFNLSETDTQLMDDLLNFDTALDSLASGNLQRQNLETRETIAICLLKSTVNALNSLHNFYVNNGAAESAEIIREAHNAYNAYLQPIIQRRPNITEQACRSSIGQLRL